MTPSIRRVPLLFQRDYEVDLMCLLVGRGTYLFFHADKRPPENRILLLRTENEGGCVTFVEDVTRHHLPITHQHPAQIVTDVVEFDKAQVIDRAWFNADRIVGDSAGLIEGGLRNDSAIEVAFRFVACRDR